MIVEYEPQGKVILAYHKGQPVWVILIGSDILTDENGQPYRFETEEAAKRILVDGPLLSDFLAPKVLH